MVASKVIVFLAFAIILGAEASGIRDVVHKGKVKILRVELLCHFQ